MTTFSLLGDQHLGKVFVNNVPLHRRGDHEKIVWAEFRKQLDPKGAEVHVNMGDLYDKPFVPYGVVWCSAQLYLKPRAPTPTRRSSSCVATMTPAAIWRPSAPSTSSRGWSPRRRTSAASRIGSPTDELVFFGWHPVHVGGRDRGGLRPQRTRHQRYDRLWPLGYRSPVRPVQPGPDRPARRRWDHQGVYGSRSLPRDVHARWCRRHCAPGACFPTPTARVAST